MNELNDLRNNIDEIDDSIVKLLSERFDVVKNIAEYKKERGLEIFQQDREAAVLKRISDKVNNQEYKEYILKIYAVVLETSKSMQYKL